MSQSRREEIARLIREALKEMGYHHAPPPAIYAAKRPDPPIGQPQPAANE